MLLHAALGGREQAPQAWRRWKQAGGTPELDDGASRLLPLVYRNLSSCGFADPDMTMLRVAHRRAWAANQLLFHAVAPLINALGEAGIGTIALKGAALAVAYYADSGTRPMGDFDLLVGFPDVRRAIGAMGELGWAVDPSVPLDGLLVTRHAVNCRSGEHALDLHWRALYHPGDDAPFWERSIPISVHGASTRALGPEDQLIHVCVHGVGADPGPLRWVADAAMVIGARELDWELVVAEARRREVTVAVTAALRFLAARLNMPIPEAVLGQLSASRPAVSERLAHRAATSTRRGRGFAVEWRRHRTLRRLEPGLTPRSYLVHLQYMWGLPNRRQVFARLARKVFQVARHGHSHPRGERLLRG